MQTPESGRMVRHVVARFSWHRTRVTMQALVR